MPVAIVTGAARERGIGRGIVLALAERGFDVVINDVSHGDSAQRRVAEVEALGRRAAFIRADVRRPTECDRLVSATVDRLGRLDVFVANAGVASWHVLRDVSREDWDQVMGVNLHGAFFGCRAAAAQMRLQGGGGNIVVVSSVHAVMTGSPLGLYGASKHAVGMLVGVMAREWAEDGIAVNHVGPGWVDTNINDVSPDFATEEKRAAARAAVPLGHGPIEPREIGEAVAYLVAADTVTGAYVSVDGGLMIGKY